MTTQRDEKAQSLARSASAESTTDVTIFSRGIGQLVDVILEIANADGLVGNEQVTRE